LRNLVENQALAKHWGLCVCIHPEHRGEGLWSSLSWSPLPILVEPVYVGGPGTGTALISNNTWHPQDWEELLFIRPHRENKDEKNKRAPEPGMHACVRVVRRAPCAVQWGDVIFLD
jgi:hypothetical protein